MTKDEALKLALEALEEINKLSIGENAICLPAEIDTAMDAIKEALAQPEHCSDCGQKLGDANHIHTCSPQPEQEPVAWLSKSGKGLWFHKPDASLDATPLYTAIAQRKPLTDNEIEVLAKKHNGIFYDCDIEFARAIEAAHGIKE